jgi:hypothetical protein
MMNAPARGPSFRSDEALRQLAGRASRKRPDCRWQPRNHTRTVPLTATQPHVDSVFVPRSVQQSRAEIGLTKLRRGVDECAGSEAVGYRPHYGKIKGTPPRGAKPLIRYGFPAGRRSVGSATRRQKARLLKALFGTSHTAIPERPHEQRRQRIRDLMGPSAIGAAARASSTRFCAPRGEQVSKEVRRLEGGVDRGWPLGVRARPHRVQPQPSVRRRASCRRQGPVGPPSRVRLPLGAAVGPRRLPRARRGQPGWREGLHVRRHRGEHRCHGLRPTRRIISASSSRRRND